MHNHFFYIREKVEQIHETIRSLKIIIIRIMRNKKKIELRVHYCSTAKEVKKRQKEFRVQKRLE
jgi:hypothetical protein